MTLAGTRSDRHGAAGPPLAKIDFSDIPSWSDDDHLAAFRAFCVGAEAIASTQPKTRALGVDGAGLQRIAQAALAAQPIETSKDARYFFEKHFVPHRIDAAGFVTGYFEPEVEASRTRTSRFAVPLLGRPSDLVDVAEADRPPGWDPEIRFAKKTPAASRRSSTAPRLRRGRSLVADLRSPSSKARSMRSSFTCRGQRGLGLRRARRCGSPSQESPAIPTRRSGGLRSSADCCRSKAPTRTGSKRG